jgi:hypothetical protein
VPALTPDLRKQLDALLQADENVYRLRTLKQEAQAFGGSVLGFKAPSQYAEGLIRPAHKVNTARIVREWPNIQRFPFLQRPELPLIPEKHSLGKQFRGFGTLFLPNGTVAETLIRDNRHTIGTA